MSININSRYLDDGLKKAWPDGVTETTKEPTNDESKSWKSKPILIDNPFRCFALPEFVDFSNYETTINDSNTENDVLPSCVSKRKNSYLDLLLEELESLEMNEIKNDLYNFRQSADLANINTPAIEAFKTLFTTHVKRWIQRVTGINLDDRVSMTASAYGYSNYLLCHDDELERRRIAYTFYLTPDWSGSYGGCLDLFSSDDKLQPLDVVKSIIPFQNTLVFFEVVPRSFHQVSEVTTKEKVRWSINGWFYGDAIARPKTLNDELPSRLEPCCVEFDDLMSWINPDYLDEETQASIRGQFEDTSEIQLQNFLQAERYEAVLKELGSDQLNWKRKGPWNKRNYLALDVGTVLDEKSLPNLSLCLRIMHSDAMYLLLSQFTNVTLHPLYSEVVEDGNVASSSGAHDVDYSPPTKRSAPNDQGDTAISSAGNASQQGAGSSRMEAGNELLSCEFEVRRFEMGSYTVLQDSDFAASKGENEATMALDAQLFFTKHDWDVNHGGSTYYFEKDSSEELVMVTPCGNALTLVCREPGVSKFVKYINHTAVDDFGELPNIIDISATFYETDRMKNNSSDTG